MIITNDIIVTKNMMPPLSCWLKATRNIPDTKYVKAAFPAGTNQSKTNRMTPFFNWWIWKNMIKINPEIAIVIVEIFDMNVPSIGITPAAIDDLAASVTDESTEFASETFTILEAEKTKSTLELAFESSKIDAPVTFNNVVTEVIQLESDYFEQIDEFSGESEFGTITVTRPNTKIAQSTLDISGTVYSTSLEAISGLVEITFTRPSGDIEELTTILTKDGAFDTILVESWISGDYTLHASYDGNTISELTFFIGDKLSDIDTSSTTQCQDVNCVSVDSEDAILSSPIMIMIDGDFENVDSDISLDVKLIRPDNTSVELSTTLSASGEFESPLVHSEEWISGVYTVIVSYHGDQLSAASFRK